jgi:uncharacterized membrane protein YfcA
MPIWALVLLSLLIGSLTGLFGIGGGFLAIPVLVLFFHTPQNKAAGTSLLIIALNCMTAFIAKSSIWPEINWHYPTVIALSAVFVSGLASKLAPKAPTVHLKRGFALLLFTLAAFTILTKVI